MHKKQAVYWLSHLSSSSLCSLYPSTEPHNPGVSTVAWPLSPLSRQQSLHGTNCGPCLLRDSKGSHSLVLVSLTCFISAVSNPPGENLLILRLGTSPPCGVPSPKLLPNALLPLGKPSLGGSGEATLWGISSQGLCGALSRLQSLKNTSHVLTS